MANVYWNNWYAGWGFFLWWGMLILIFSSAGNWGYTYQAHRRFRDRTEKDALDVLSERYARGDITREEFHRVKSELQEARTSVTRATSRSTRNEFSATT
jgi:putative membrane protein